MKFVKVQTPWNKGLTKENNEILKRISEANREKLKCKLISEETRLKKSKSMKIAHSKKQWGFIKNDTKTIEIARSGGKASPTKFKKGTTIRNTGRTRFKKGEFRVVNNPFHFKLGHPRPANAFSFPKGNQYAKGKKKSSNAYKFPVGNPYRFRPDVRNNPKGEFKVGDPRHKDKYIQMKRIKNLIKKPNKQESSFNSFLQSNFPGQFTYSGDGEVLIGNKCPDFIGISDNKKVIELLGTYWHDPKRRKLLPHQTENGTIEHYRKYGFDCLIVWENELKNLHTLFVKIRDFIKDGG